MVGTVSEGLVKEQLEIDLFVSYTSYLPALLAQVWRRNVLYPLRWGWKITTNNGLIPIPTVQLPALKKLLKTFERLPSNLFL